MDHRFLRAALIGGDDGLAHCLCFQHDAAKGFRLNRGGNHKVRKLIGLSDKAGVLRNADVPPD